MHSVTEWGRAPQIPAKYAPIHGGKQRESDLSEVSIRGTVPETDAEVEKAGV